MAFLIGQDYLLHKWGQFEARGLGRTFRGQKQQRPNGQKDAGVKVSLRHTDFGVFNVGCRRSYWALAEALKGLY